RADVRRRRGLRAVVAQRLLAVREVEPDRAPTLALREADARLAERALLRGQEAAAAREDRRRCATVGAERPRVRFHALDIDATGREPRVDARARLGTVLAVEDARNEPAR